MGDCDRKPSDARSSGVDSCCVVEYCPAASGNEGMTPTVANRHWNGCMMSTAEVLREELATYERRKAELLKNEGKFVLIHASEVDVWDTYEDALKAGYEKYGLKKPFLVKQIQAIERLQCFTRDIGPCQS